MVQVELRETPRRGKFLGGILGFGYAALTNASVAPRSLSTRCKWSRADRTTGTGGS
jgi:hypothetical protein